MFSLLQNGKLRAHVTDLVKCSICKFDPGLEVAILRYERNYYALDLVYRYVFYCPICKGKHKLVIQQIIIIEVIQSAIRTVKYFDELLIKINQ